jgi:hypothetical protein
MHHFRTTFRLNSNTEQVITQISEMNCIITVKYSLQNYTSIKSPFFLHALPLNLKVSTHFRATSEGSFTLPHTENSPSAQSLSTLPFIFHSSVRCMFFFSPLHFINGIGEFSLLPVSRQSRMKWTCLLLALTPPTQRLWHPWESFRKACLSL